MSATCQWNLDAPCAKPATKHTIITDAVAVTGQAKLRISFCDDHDRERVLNTPAYLTWFGKNVIKPQGRKGHA
jgi:hypothetical protein